MVIDKLSSRLAAALTVADQAIRCEKALYNGQEIMLAKPQTYMNRSGEPLRGLAVAPENLIVIYDDMDIPFGRIRLRRRGSDGGHRGMRSIIAALGTSDFVRVRCGIGRGDATVASDYVLGKFDAAEQEILRAELDLAADAVLACIADGPERAMNVFNKRANE